MTTKSAPDRVRRERDEARAEAASLRQILDQIQREASRRFEGKSCARCLKIEALASGAPDSSQADDTNEIKVGVLEKLISRDPRPK